MKGSVLHTWMKHFDINTIINHTYFELEIPIEFSFWRSYGLF